MILKENPVKTKMWLANSYRLKNKKLKETHEQKKYMRRKKCSNGQKLQTQKLESCSEKAANTKLTAKAEMMLTD